MSLLLPAPLDLYFAAENSGDLSVVDRCFAADAIVRDEGASIKGIPAIKAWKAAAHEASRYTAEPLSASPQDGRFLVRCRVSGAFPGSPVLLDHVFEIEDGRITGLEIR